MGSLLISTITVEVDPPHVNPCKFVVLPLDADT
jgi:hypothetical protein